ncbi:MAG: Thiamine-triphosphatase, partial [Candidatus Uhrbacteria bacterium GW2011_GWA2_53_10]
MIEIERKFAVTEEGKRRLTEGAEFVSEKTMTDTYYDTVDFQLTTKDRWLRLRDGKWELKEPLHALGFSKRAADQYRELITEGEIRTALRLPAGQDIEADLAKTGYEPFATIKTVRRKYKKEGFVIDLDVMDFGYEIGEIELMVASEQEMDAAVARILEFGKENGL